MGRRDLLLFIAGVNITNLSLARASGRLKELATRHALGAARGRVIRQLVTETTILTVLGGLLGLGLGYWSLGALTALGLADIPRAHEIRMDATVVAFILGLAFALGVVVGLVPAMHVAGVNLSIILREDSRTGTAGRAARAYAERSSSRKSRSRSYCSSGQGCCSPASATCWASTQGSRPSTS